MFTGIIEAVGTLRKLERKGDDIRLTVASGKLDLNDVRLGDSIATNGVCLTVVQQLADGYVADVSAETVSLTGFANYKVGTKVNLEKAVTPTTRLGGHMVSGHVDGIAMVEQRLVRGQAIEFWLAAPAELGRYIAHKGSITIDGVSLTVNEVDGSRFRLTIVPHTAGETTLIDLQAGDKVNIEVDLIARYLERLMNYDGKDSKSGGVTMEMLARAGFVR
ncbi:MULTISPECIES: riboflavin synthase [Shewanella]|uniref:Riboflavin synthase n=1 Tax=Shewanella baltica (strain OS155 / ATCC BAA-1091) TaxID=325240 RepID=A3D7C7_SHEB5|nr:MULTISPECIES: riboflavin synthase [Shewanella]ABN62640.1 riboflavin synthase, alpha subunit [Shewanella baltica OS155]ACK45725.1 riboflavin synthase, alpha subunit [Shewanella baltica OS223]AEG10480.1 riboflavin synthase, alpha subunit [Shewanella baltica BA175]AEH14978.1 riboflavin synthase, alpha subunit [Shewanella baltica OS117]EHQ15987.1 riboflavin synthase, alpha subunit [Shewanella baltica OS183]